MILSHQHQFVFLKTRKAGGTSVEIGLSRFCGPEDVLTPITPRDEIVRIADGRACQNYTDDREAELAYLDKVAICTDQEAPPRAPTASMIYTNHMTLENLRDLHPSLPDSYTIIATERHPYDKALSRANWDLRRAEYHGGGAMNITTEDLQAGVDDLIASGQMEASLRCWDTYCLDGEPRADIVLQHSRLQDDFNDLCTRFGFVGNFALPHTKVGGRDRSESARDLLSPTQKSYVYDLCREEFEYFDYAA